jgi:WD40 repeat protein
VPSGKKVGALKGHVGGMTEATFSPDGRTLATGAYDGRIKLWNTVIRQGGTLKYPGMITGLQFSPDGRSLAASVWTAPGYRAILFRAPSLEEVSRAEQDNPPADAH